MAQYVRKILGKVTEKERQDPVPVLKEASFIQQTLRTYHVFISETLGKQNLIGTHKYAKDKNLHRNDKPKIQDRDYLWVGGDIATICASNILNWMKYTHLCIYFYLRFFLRLKYFIIIRRRRTRQGLCP